MDASLFWTLLASIVGVIASFLTSRHYALRKRITILCGHERWLLSRDGRSPKLKITYNGSTVRDNLIEVDYFVCNTGNSDIRMDPDTPLVFRLPDYFTWIKTELLFPFDDLQVRCAANGGELLVYWDNLLKRGEFFELASLVEYAGPQRDSRMKERRSSLLEKMQVKSRLKNLCPIAKRKLDEFAEEDYDGVVFSTCCGVLLLGIIVLGCLFFDRIFRAPWRFGVLFIATLINAPIYWVGLVGRIRRRTGYKSILEYGLRNEKRVWDR